MGDETRGRERSREEAPLGPDAARPAPGAANAARFLLLCALCVLLTGAYAWFTMTRPGERFGEGALPPITGPLGAADVQTAPDPPAEVAPAPVAPEWTSAGSAESAREADTARTETLPADTSPAPEPEGPVESARAARLSPPAAAVPEEPGAASEDRATAAPAPSVRQFLMRHTGLDRSHGFLAVETDVLGTRERQATPLTCHRLHFAAGHGSCLVVERQFFTTYTAVLFDAAFRPTHRIELNGIPSRTRVSPDGRHAAITVFVSGHSYSDSLFSTETTIVDTGTGELLVASLEEFPVVRDGQPFHSLDFNFWGVTFAADGDRFFATLGTGGTVFLVEGSLAARALRVVTEGIECPALSPNGTRVAFKKRMPGAAEVHWRPHVLDLETLEVTALAETRSVDDQIEWLDDESILYALPEEPGSPIAHVWALPADGSGEPEIFLEQASSPTVLRGGAPVDTAPTTEG